MKLLFLLTFLPILGLVACTKENDNSTETWWVNSARVDCVGMRPMTCLQVQKNEKPDSNSWLLFYDEIKGFNFEPGNIYQIKVKVTKKAEPVPADASSLNYKFVELISKEIDRSLRLTNIWKVVQVGDINNPQHSTTKEALIFEFNATAKTYSGNMGCNTVRGQIIENDGEKLSFGPGASTKMACPDLDIENSIGKAIAETKSYRIENNRLKFLNEAGKILIEFLAVD